MIGNVSDGGVAAGVSGEAAGALGGGLDGGEGGSVTEVALSEPGVPVELVD